MSVIPENNMNLQGEVKMQNSGSGTNPCDIGYSPDNMYYNQMYTANYPMNTGYHQMKLAAAYVPYQYLNYVYPPMTGLMKGTIFPELDRPYGVDPEYTVDA